MREATWSAIGQLSETSERSNNADTGAFILMSMFAGDLSVDVLAVAYAAAALFQL